jgi:cell wall-associated NlpC family hydrolase
MLLVPIAFLVANCSTTRLEKYDPSKRYKGVSSTKYSTSQLREGIASHARKFVGTPYVYAGTTPKGFDCSGFTSYVLNDYKINIPRSSRGQAEIGKKIELAKVRPGDLIFFSKNGKGSISHVALVINNTRAGIQVAHSTSSRGVIIENVSTSKYWKPKLKYARDVISQ